MGLFDKLKKQEPAPKTTLVPNVGRMPYPAYRGKEPYIFISYAHLDYEKVFSEIKTFNEHGYNVWYDEGISPGNEWTDEIAFALEKCSLFVVFITPNSANSKNVLKEINFAIEDGKALVAIHLEKTTLSGGIKLQISTIQAILKYTMSQEEYVYKYTTAFTRLGMHAKLKVPSEAPTQTFTAPSAEPPVSVPAQQANTAPPHFEREITRVGDFIVEHGHLHEYLGTEKNIKLPDIVQIIGSLGQGSKFIETVDLNKAGALFTGAFSDCPNLREIRIPRTVTMIQKIPFMNCPQLMLYCYRDQLPQGFAEYFGGKEIVYLDEAPAATPAAPDDRVVFRSSEMRRLVCAELGVGEDTVITKEMCDKVTAISVCGNAVGRRFNAYTNDGTNVRVVPIAGTNETMTTVGRGSLDSLEDVPLLRNLNKLIIPYQSVYDLTPLSGSKIERLDLASNMLGDLSPLASMRFLKNLDLSYAQTESFAALGKSRSILQITFPGIRQSQFDELCET
ncbi:MAG: TIR domain-containing protein, partial [Oscillospiraceae bacterium]